MSDIPPPTQKDRERDPAADLAVCDAATPPPWDYDNVPFCEDRSAYAVLVNEEGKVLADTFNSDVAVIHEEPDEASVHYWDETGRRNLTFAALARTALPAYIRLYIAERAAKERLVGLLRNVASDIDAGRTNVEQRRLMVSTIDATLKEVSP